MKAAEDGEALGRHLMQDACPRKEEKRAMFL
jgi:hypothetical protein